MWKTFKEFMQAALGNTIWNVLKWAVSGGLIMAIGSWLESLAISEIIFLAVLLSTLVFCLFEIYASKKSRRLSPETKISVPEQNTAEIGRYQVSRNLMPKLITIGYPKNMASEPHLSWWHVPVSLNRIKDSPIRSLDHCSVDLHCEGFNKVKLRWTSPDRVEGESEASLRIGEEPKDVPIVARTEIALPFLPAMKSRITDTNFLVHKSNFTDIRFTPGIKNHKLKLEIRFEDWSWSRIYYLCVPSNIANNGHFIMFPSSIQWDLEIEVRQQSSSIS